MHRPEQGENGATHVVEDVHDPATHAWPLTHTRPHALQLLRSLRRSDSHPFEALPSQLPKFASHRMPHVELPHVGCVCEGVGQRLPQVPQFPVSVTVFTQLPEHGVRGGVQVDINAHVPLTHA